MSDTSTLPWTSEPALAPFAGHLERSEGRVASRYRELTVRSGFQPIYSFAHGRPVGFEALARAWDADGRPVSPLALLSRESPGEKSVFLDRLLRALHVANFSTYDYPDAWLFLNVSPEVVVNGRAYGPFFKEMLRAVGMPAHRVVVEVTESEADEMALEQAAVYYKKMGCLIAIDDFGAGHSNFQRIWRLRPDLIKLDRGMIAQAAVDVSARRALVGVAALLHEIGALVIAEGIETEAEAVAVLQAEVDLLQGYYFQRPFVGEPPASLDAKERFDHLRKSLLRQSKSEDSDSGAALKPYLDAFAAACDGVAKGVEPEAAAGRMLDLPRSLRCYVLDAEGRQIGGNLAGAGSVRLDPRYAPLKNVRGANWMHRHYFRRAILAPGRTQVSRPYLSLTDPSLCMTISRAIETTAGPRVLCCDLLAPS